MSTEDPPPIEIKNIWKPPEYERCLPELLETARTTPQYFKVWKGDRPRCEIETKACVHRTQARLRKGEDAPLHEVWEFVFQHRADTDFWPVLYPIIRVLGQPILLTMTGKVVVYKGSGDPITPFVDLIARW